MLTLRELDVLGSLRYTNTVCIMLDTKVSTAEGSVGLVQSRKAKQPMCNYQHQSFKCKILACCCKSGQSMLLNPVHCLGCSCCLELLMPDCDNGHGTDMSRCKICGMCVFVIMNSTWLAKLHVRQIDCHSMCLHVTCSYKYTASSRLSA